jgi:hypothetical protein
VLFTRFFDLFPAHTLFAPLVREDIPVPDAAALFFRLVKD